MAAAFALTPAVAVVGVIDFTTVVGRKLYEPDGLYQFLQSVSNQARSEQGAQSLFCLLDTAISGAASSGIKKKESPPF
jgi:hypothetical protein